MAGWETSTSYAKSINADGYINKAQSARANDYKKVQNKALGTGKNYDLRGINASQIPAMIEAMENYIKKINNKIDAMKANTSSASAFKGTELGKAVTAYIQKVETYLKRYTSQLRAFEDKIIDVRNAWNAAQKAQATTINKAATAFAEVKAYNRQLQ